MIKGGRMARAPARYDRAGFSRGLTGRAGMEP
jgi:hypothetical protein